MEATLKGKPDDTPAPIKHPSFQNRPVPVLQLMSQVSAMGGGLKPQFQAVVNNLQAQDAANAAMNPVDEQPKVYPRSNQSQIGAIFQPEDDIEDEAENKKNENLLPAQTTTIVIGDEGNGTSKFDRFDRTSALEKKKILLKPFTQPDTATIISPITGEISASYQIFLDKQKVIEEDRRRKEEEQRLLDEENNTSDDHPLLIKMRKSLNKKGGTGVLGLSRTFKIMDSDGSKTLSLAEFKKAMKYCQVALSGEETATLFNLFDVHKKGCIEYDDFIRIIRGNLNNRRRRLVGMAFNILDKRGCGEVTFDDIAEVYDVSKHPDFVAGKKTKKMILDELLSNFEVGGNVDGTVTREEFFNYYSNISASIDNEDYFELMIRNAWHISGGEGAAANTANKRVLVTLADGTQRVEEIKNDLGLKAGDKEGIAARLKAQNSNAASISTGDKLIDKRRGSGAQGGPPPLSSSQRNSSATPSSSSSAKPANYTPAPRLSPVDLSIAKELLATLKRQLASRGGMGFITLQRQFRLMDDDGNLSLSPAEFKNAMRDFQLGFTDAQVALLFKYFDVHGANSVSFDNFLNALRGDLNERRTKLVNMAFDVLDKDGSGIVEPADLMGTYDASKHPDVISGRKTSDQVLREFLDGFDVGGEVDGKVTREEFLNYYRNISASIDNEDYFELMIRNAWHISGGEGAAANTANKRVLVTLADGTQRVEEIKNDRGLKSGDKEGMVARLRAQGVEAANVANTGIAGDTNQGGGAPPAGPPPSSLLGRLMTGISNPAQQQQQQQGVRPAPQIPTKAEKYPKLTPQEIALAGPKGHVGSQAGGGSAGVVAAQASNGNNNNAVKKAPVPAAAAGGGAAAAVSVVTPGLSFLLQKIRKELKARNTNGFIGLQRAFNTLDLDGSGSLSQGEFKKALIEMGMESLDPSEMRKIFEFFDADKSGTIELQEFIDGVREPLSEKRQFLIQLAFSFLDKMGKKCIPVREVAGSYDASSHPEVMAGRMLSDEALMQFLETFDAGGEIEGQCTRNEFFNYWANISAVIDSDDYFELLIRNVWRLNGTNEANGRNGDRVAMAPTSGYNNSNSNSNSNNRQGQYPVAPPRAGSRDPSPRGSKDPSPRNSFSIPNNANYAMNYNNNNNNNKPSNMTPGGGGSNIILPTPPQNFGGIRRNSSGVVSPEYSITDVEAEVATKKKQAVDYYSKRNYRKAEQVFQEIVDLYMLVYPPDSAECAKARKALMACQRVGL